MAPVISPSNFFDKDRILLPTPLVVSEEGARFESSRRKGCVVTKIKTSKAAGEGTKAKPWKLQTPPGTSSYEAYRDEDAEPRALVVQVGKTQLRYHLRAIEDLAKMLAARGDWMLLGSADEQKPAADDTVEAWGRSEKNPVKGWYGLKKGLRGRFAMYVPPVLEVLGLAELEHNAKNNRMRAAAGK